MRQDYSGYHQSGVVVLDREDFPVSEDLVIATAYVQGATKRASRCRDLFVVRFPGGAEKAITITELRRSIRYLNQRAKSA